MKKHQYISDKSYKEKKVSKKNELKTYQRRPFFGIRCIWISPVLYQKFHHLLAVINAAL